MDEEASLTGADGANESLWNSPEKPARKANSAKPYAMNQDGNDASLREELANVRKVNQAIEGVLQSLERAKANMTTVNHTVGAASSLLNTWTRILSQTEHNQRLILDPTWQGTSQDLADIEAAAMAKQEAALRKEAEEQDRRKAAVHKAEQEEQRRTEALRPPKQVPRGRGRGNARAGTAAATFSGSTASANNSTLGIGRGTISSTSASNPSRRATTGSGIGRGRGRAGRGHPDS